MTDKTKFRINLPIDQLVGGGFVEKLEGELEKVFENIHDPNTQPTAKRTVTSTLKFTPDEEREIIQLEMDFTTKLAPVEGLTTKIITDRDLRTNTIAAQEFMSTQRGQTYIDENGQMRTDVGEPIDVIEKEISNVHRLKKGNE